MHWFLFLVCPSLKFFGSIDPMNGNWKNDLARIRTFYDVLLTIRYPSKKNKTKKKEKDNYTHE